MKKNRVIALTTVFVLGLSSFVYAGWVKGFVVVGVSEEVVTIKKGQEEAVQVPAGRIKFEVGDKVLFDVEKRKIRKKPEEGC